MAASSDNLIIGAQPWPFPSWISEAYARDSDTQILTKALQVSISNNREHDNDFVKLQTNQSFSSSETESVSKRAPVSGKITKRKPRGRGSKRSPTMFIAADPQNFKQMVQQVTGPTPAPVGSLLKPQPQRVLNRLQTACLLPTLDTSAFLLDHHQQKQQIVGSNSVEFGPSAVVGDVGGPGFDFDGFAGFPLL